MSNEKKKERPTSLEVVNEAIAYYNYAYDTQRGWTLTTNTLPENESYTIMATKIRNYLEQKKSPVVPTERNIIAQLELLQQETQKQYAVQCYEKIKYNSTAKDTSEEICRLISGNNYNAIYPAILRQVIYSVKSKMIGKVVQSPIFPIIYGGAGIGKSRFIRALCKAIPEHKYAFIKAGDKIVNSESHTAMLHDNLIIHLDEMSGLSKADIGKLKTLDAPYVAYRPLYTNTTKRAFNCATLIGATNTSVKNILISTEDNRKWVQINFYEPPQTNGETFIRSVIDKIEGFDYMNLWQSVNENGVEPFTDANTYTLYKQYVKEVCSSSTPTTDFINEYLEKHAGEWVSKADLYCSYKNEVDTETHRMGKDRFYELCEKRGFTFRRQPGIGRYGYDLPAKIEEETF